MLFLCIICCFHHFGLAGREAFFSAGSVIAALVACLFECGEIY